MTNRLRAFTLVELVVSIGIISLISGVVFFNFPQFNQTVHLNRSARELTVALREAQARAIAVTPLPDGTFPNNYAVFIEKTPANELDGKYVIFTDLNANLKYDTPDPLKCLGECVKKIIFTNGIKRKEITVIAD